MTFSGGRVFPSVALLFWAMLMWVYYISIDFSPPAFQPSAHEYITLTAGVRPAGGLCTGQCGFRREDKETARTPFWLEEDECSARGSSEKKSNFLYQFRGRTESLNLTATCWPNGEVSLCFSESIRKKMSFFKGAFLILRSVLWFLFHSFLRKARSWDKPALICTVDKCFLAAAAAALLRGIVCLLSLFISLCLFTIPPSHSPAVCWWEQVALTAVKLN